ncbi:MAG: phosphoribosylformylglycinamidine synthase [Candidatus Eisenbacteria bacterium]|nr:phosphoribosylformylglycinamidine synthase [Candidatus Eisenbacteria bacterium]
MDVEVETLSIIGRADDLVAEELRGHGLRLTVAEARHLARLIGRNPTKVEATIFDIMWSEHCSYKSSRHLLKEHLPTEARNVVLGPGEDAGIIKLCEHEGESFCLVVAHESHNHPSQVMPFEGAATGIGGIVRDVYCMGADVCAVMDALRFGDPHGPHKNKVREVASGVVSGIWQYGNALGVANMGGDVCFDACYDENCLVNVIAMGVVKEREIVRSRVPAAAARERYELILFGKPTDASGFGGAAFASDVLDSDELSESKAAVQVPDPFLKRILAEANKKMLELVHSRGLEIGFKDLGAGGIACATSEIAAAGGFGALIDLSKVPVETPKAGGELPPEVVVCSETQERFVLAVPSSVTGEILHIYNEEYELPHIYHGARAVAIGSVTTDGVYRIVTGAGREAASGGGFVLGGAASAGRGRVVSEGLGQGGSRDAQATAAQRLLCDVKADVITSGITIRRESRVAECQECEPRFAPPKDLGEFLLELLGSPNGASRWPIFSFYDCEVGGRTVIRPGDADAGVFAPLPGSPVGVAVSVDGAPAYGKISQYWAGAHAVAESMRNVACVGATPRALSDCLNFGSPEDPDVFHGFEETLRGVGDAARRICQVDRTDPSSAEPVPIVTGNVSFYNQTATGKAVAASPIVACYGVMEDYSKAVTMGLKRPGSLLFLIGRRYDELGGSLYYERLLGCVGRNVPLVRFGVERSAIRLVLGAIDRGLLEACHDVSSGGVAVTLSEMCMAGRDSCGAGVDLTGVAGIPNGAGSDGDSGAARSAGVAWTGGLRYDRKLFSESPGFVVEVASQNVNDLSKLAAETGVKLFRLGAVLNEPVLRARDNGKTVLEATVGDIRKVWSRGLEHALA